MMKFIVFCVFLIVVQYSESRPGYQFLPPRDGYVPVYIRLGDTPLDEINPSLAVAFHEHGLGMPLRKVKTEEIMMSDQQSVPLSSSSSEEEINQKIENEKKKKENIDTKVESEDSLSESSEEIISTNEKKKDNLS